MQHKCRFKKNTFRVNVVILLTFQPENLLSDWFFAIVPRSSMCNQQNCLIACVQQLISAFVTHSSLLMTYVLISQLTVYLQGGSKACLCDCQSYNQNSYYVVMNYTYSTVALSTVGVSGKLCALQQILVLLQPVHQTSCSLGPVATYSICSGLQHEITFLLLVVTHLNALLLFLPFISFFSLMWQNLQETCTENNGNCVQTVHVV